MKVNKTLTAAVVVLGVFVVWGTLRVTHLKGTGSNPSTPSQTAQNTQTTQSTQTTQTAQTANVATGTSESTAPAKTGSASESKAGAAVSLNEISPKGAKPSTGGKTSEMAKAELEKSEPAGSCAMITFHHKKLPTHATDDECSHHRNLIKLSRNDINPDTLCIRVNNTPVRYERVAGKTDEFIIGPVAGPHDTVTARFCTGKIKCAEACVYPAHDPVKHDEFLDAIGGTDSGADTQLAHWEAGDAEKTNEVNQAVDGEIKKELQAQDDAAKKAAQSKMEIFKDWVLESEKAACGSPSAHAPASVAASR